MALELQQLEPTDREPAATADHPPAAETATRDQPRPPISASLGHLELVLLGLVFAYILCFAWQTRHYFVDDAYTGLQYLRNLLSGEGFVLCAGQPAVEGVTNIGWLLCLAPLAALVPPTLAAKAAGLALLLIVLALTLQLGRDLSARRAQPESLADLDIVPVVLLVSSFDFVYFSLAGMETASLAAVLLVMARVGLRRPASLWLPVLGTFAFLIHPEAVIVYPVYLLLLLRSSVASERRLCLGGLLLAALVAAVTAIRYAYFQDVVPNTFYSKPSSLSQVVAGGRDFLLGRNVNLPFAITGWFALPVLTVGYLGLRRRVPAAAAMLAAVITTGLVFSIYCPPDWTQMARYFAPYLPAALVLLWVGVIQTMQHLLPRRSQATMRGVAAVAVVVLLVVTETSHGKAEMATMETFPGYVLASERLVEPSLWVRDHLPPQATIATRRIGTLAYHSQRPVFDYAFGLPDRQVARLVAAAGCRFDDPNHPALAAVWRETAPDYLLEDADVMHRIISQAGGTPQRFAIHGLPYRVIRSFRIGVEAEWVLAQRLDGQGQLEKAMQPGRLAPTPPSPHPDH